MQERILSPVEEGMKTANHATLVNSYHAECGKILTVPCGWMASSSDGKAYFAPSYNCLHTCIMDACLEKNVNCNQSHIIGIKAKTAVWSGKEFI